MGDHRGEGGLGQLLADWFQTPQDLSPALALLEVVSTNTNVGDELTQSDVTSSLCGLSVGGYQDLPGGGEQRLPLRPLRHARCRRPIANPNRRISQASTSDRHRSAPTSGEPDPPPERRLRPALGRHPVERFDLDHAARCHVEHQASCVRSACPWPSGRQGQRWRSAAGQPRSPIVRRDPVQPCSEQSPTTGQPTEGWSGLANRYQGPSSSGAGARPRSQARSSAWSARLGNARSRLASSPSTRIGGQSETR